MQKKVTTYLKGHQEKLLPRNETRIMASHQRCTTAGVDRYLSASKGDLPRQIRNRFLLQHSGLIAYAHRLFMQVYDLSVDHNQVFLLADPEVRVIEMYSRAKILEMVRLEKNIKPGTSIKEESVGTNAVALALIHRESAIIRGNQHFCQIFQDNLCVAAPIIGPGSGLLGCVCIVTRHNAPLGEKLAVVTFMAKELQNFLNFMSTSPLALRMQPSTASATSDDHCSVILTSRQHEVLEYFSLGLSYKQIADKLGLRAVKTVEEHLDNIRDKLSAPNRRACIRIALEIGLL